MDWKEALTKALIIAAFLAAGIAVVWMLTACGPATTPYVPAPVITLEQTPSAPS